MFYKLVDTVLCMLMIFITIHLSQKFILGNLSSLNIIYFVSVKFFFVSIIVLDILFISFKN